MKNGSTQTTIYTGLVHQELESKLLEKVHEANESDPLALKIIVVGSRMLKQYLLRLISEERSSFFNLQTMTLSALAWELQLNGIIADRRPALPNGGGLTAASHCAKQTANNGFYSEVAQRKGFIHALASLFNDFVNYGINVEADETSPEETESQPKIKALIDLYSGYAKTLNKFRSPGDNLKLDLVQERLPDWLNDCRNLFFYGLYDFTGLQFELIKNLSLQIDATFFFPYWNPEDAYGSAFVYAEPAFKALMNLEDVKVEPLLPACGCAFKGFGWRLFRYHPKEMQIMFYPSGRVVKIFSSVSVSGEIETITGKINRLALWDDVPLHKIGVLLWQPEIYKEQLIQALSEAGFPCCDAVGTRLSETTEGRALKEMLSLMGQNRRIKRRDLVDFIANRPVILMEENELQSIPDPALWEKYSVDAGIIEGYYAQWIDALNRVENEYKSEGDGEGVETHIDQIQFFRDFLEDIFVKLEKLLAAGSFAAFKELLMDLIARFMPASGTTQQLINSLGDMENLDIIDNGFRYEEFCDQLFRTLGNIKINIDEFGGGVTIMDKMVSRGVGFDVLFMPGMAHGKVPVVSSEDALLSDNERNRLSDRFLKDRDIKLPEKQRRREEERMLFALAVDSARSQIYFSFPEFDPDKGNECLPSRFLMEICRIINGKPVDVEKLKKLPLYENTSERSHSADKADDNKIESTVYNYGQCIQRYINATVPLNQRHIAYRSLYSGKDAEYDRIIAMRDARGIVSKYSDWDGMTGISTGKIESSAEPVRITDLEAYATCPFRYFIRRILGADKWEEPEYMTNIPNWATGQIIHGVLKSLFDRVKSDGFRHYDKKDMGWFDRITPEIIDAEIRKIKPTCPAPQILWDLSRRQIASRIYKCLLNEMSTPDGYKYEYGEYDVKHKALLDSEPDSIELNLTGRVDRIDYGAGKKGIRIVDYKTGGLYRKSELLSGGRKLQLPLYLDAMIANDGRLEPELSQAAYFQIDGFGKLKKYIYGGSMIKNKTEDIKFILKTIVENLDKGFYPPVPDKFECNRCSVETACDYRSRLKYLEENPAPEMAPFHKMREVK